MVKKTVKPSTKVATLRPAGAVPVPRPPTPLVKPGEAIVPRRPGAVIEPGPARFRPRHWLLAFSFLLFVVAPAALGIAYLYGKAADQYHSIVGFSVHSEDTSSPLDVLGVITNSGGNAASDSDILFEFIRSQQMVSEIREDLDLIEIFNKPADDPVFTLGEEPTIEEMHSYWERMVSVAYDSSAGIIEVEARAFAPEDAQAIASAVVERSTELINALSKEAREDAIRFAAADLKEAEARLADVRRQVRAFRIEGQQVDPLADVEQRMGVVRELEAELAQTLIERDVLLRQVGQGDSRVQSLDGRIDVIEGRIEKERAKIGVGAAAQGSSSSDGLASSVGEYEELVMDREFAEQAYIAVLASYTEAQAEARRQHRYLATHVGPTQAEKSLYPRRWLLSGALVFGLIVSWLVIVLIIFNVRDNR